MAKRKILTPLQLAKYELREGKKTLDYWRTVKGKDAKKQANVIAALEKQQAAYTELVKHPAKLRVWWNSISPEGQQILLGEKSWIDAFNREVPMK